MHVASSFEEELGRAHARGDLAVCAEELACARCAAILRGGAYNRPPQTVEVQWEREEP